MKENFESVDFEFVVLEDDIIVESCLHIGERD